MSEIVFTPEELRQKIYAQLDDICKTEQGLGRGYVRFGEMMVRFKSSESWRPLGYGSFDLFMSELGHRYRIGRTQMWSYLTVAEKLLPVIDAATLEEIGISKAMELKRGLKKANGKPLPVSIIEAARKQETTIKEVRALIGQAFNLAPDDKGAWFDFDGCFMTPEERKEFKDAVRTTKTLLGITNDVPEHIQRKEIFFTWMREFDATHRAEVYGPQEPVNTPAILMLPGNVPVQDDPLLGLVDSLGAGSRIG